jgi:hypothetical protein
VAEMKKGGRLVVVRQVGLLFFALLKKRERQKSTLDEIHGGTARRYF